MEILNVGINLSRAKDPWEAFAQILKAEPYLERLKSEHNDASIALHMAPRFDLAGGLKYFTATVGTFHWWPDPESMEPNTAFEFNTALDAHYIKRPYRTTPCLGVQNWFDTHQRPKLITFVLSDEAMKECLSSMGNFPSSSFLRVLSDPMDLTMQNILDSDMVVTDHCGVALVAAAASVNRVTCIEMLGDPDLLEGISSIKRFRRRSGSESDQYLQLLRFAWTEWETYTRYPKIMNEGDAQRFIQPLALQYCRGYGIDVGSNQWPFPGAIRCDIENRLEAWGKAPFDFVFSSHCLEHIQDWQEELELWHQSLKPDGIMFCYVPHPLCEVWAPEGDWVKGGWHVWSPDPISLYRHVRYELGMEVLQYSSRPDPYWGFHLIARKKC